MRFIESRHCHAATKVDTPRGCAHGLRDFILRAYGNNAAIAHGNRLSKSTTQPAKDPTTGDQQLRAHAHLPQWVTIGCMAALLAE
jgi:hypothetical protein